MTEQAPKITREEIEALLKLADAATPGPWERRETEVPIGDTGDYDVSFSINPVGSQEQIICQYWDGLSDYEPNLTYIAAANPAALKALCTLALQAEAMQPREGWMLVPVEPTQEMIEAGRPRPPKWDATPTSRKCREVADKLRRNDWKEMLSAVPALTSLPELRT